MGALLRPTHIFACPEYHSWATTRYPDEGEGYLNFDVKKAQEYTQKKADYIADVFLEAVKRWEMMEV
jgi:hypothetical protein